MMIVRGKERFEDRWIEFFGNEEIDIGLRHMRRASEAERSGRKVHEFCNVCRLSRANLHVPILGHGP